MSKLKLVAEPTFTAKVGIPVAGGDAVEVLLTFRHRTKSALDAWVKDRGEKSDEDTFMGMVSGWELTDEFNTANVKVLLENYIGTGIAAYRVYIDQLVQSKAKN